MNTDLQFVSSLLQAVLLAILPVLAGALVNWAIKAAKLKASELDQQTLNTLTWLASTAVRAAEQANLAGYIKDKKSFAMEYVETWLSGHGIQLDALVLSTAIEAAVMEEFGKAKLALVAPEKG
jgi:hypothetical protein